MKRLVYLAIFILASCASDQTISNPIDFALQSESPKIKTVTDSLDKYEVQIKLSTINRLADSVEFLDYEFRVDDEQYFYPASTVKFPVSVLALEALNSADSLSSNSVFYVEGDSTTTTFRKEIRDIFAVSSNDTFNRLFEFLGKDTINDRLRRKGLQPIRISHRLSTEDAYNLTTRPLIIQMDDSSLVSTQAMINKEIIPLKLKNILKGKGYYSGEVLVNEPMDFSLRNYLPISTLHEVMKRVMFPENFSSEQRFKLADDDRKFLMEAMSIYPDEAGYTGSDYYDSYGKFFIFGDDRSPIPEHFKIYNKVGYAYGYLTDCAYIIDSELGVEFILTATIHVNDDGIFNDDVYEYDEIGIPFLAQLGREIHTYLSGKID